MKRVTPQVYLISRPSFIEDNFQEYLEVIGAQDYKLPNAPDAEKLCEVMGKVCYNSFVPGLNPNVEKTRSGDDYLRNIISQKHGSVFAHPTYSFIFHNVSRVLTHELVRHAVGTSISQESLRFVRLTDLSAYIPIDIEKNGEALRLFVNTVNKLEEVQELLSDLYNIDSLSFKEKKALTSAFRRLAPIGLATTIGWSAGIRAIRNVIEQRSTEGAEEEIRIVARAIYDIMLVEAPAIFADYTVDSKGVITTPYPKI